MILEQKTEKADDVVVDESVKYSLAELSEANDRLFDQFEKLYFEYGISSFSMNEDLNCLIVYCDNPWTEEMKQKVLDIAGIESIEFSKLETTDGSYIEFDPNEIPPADPMLEELIQMQIDLSNKES